MHIEELKNIIYPADKVSGVEANNFTLSILGDLIKLHNTSMPYKFDFYGLGIDNLEEKAKEWIDRDLYIKESGKLLAEYDSVGRPFFAGLKTKIEKENSIFGKYCLDISRQMSDISDEKLVVSFDEFMEKYLHAYSLGIVTFIYEESMSRWLNDEISSKHHNSTEIIGALLETNYESFMMKGENSLLAIKNENDPLKKKNLADGFKRDFYYWKSNYRASSIISDDDIVELSEAAHAMPKHKSMPLDGLVFSDRENAMVSLLKDAEFIRDKRKEINLMGSYTMARFMDEAARRKRFELNIANRAFWFEYKNLLSDPESFIEKLAGRKSASIVFADGDVRYLEYDAFVEKQNLSKETDVIKGTPASVGKVSGIVYKILSSKQFGDFPEGGILVAEMTRPDFVPLMKKAKAIITDEGGLTSHAAIVARELKIPCIIGTKIATQVLQDGDLVEVNAERGIVKIIKKAE